LLITCQCISLHHWWYRYKICHKDIRQWSGVRHRARRQHETTTSQWIERTVSKVQQYMGLLIVCN
jgi:hypothetical protein